MTKSLPAFAPPSAVELTVTSQREEVAVWIRRPRVVAAAEFENSRQSPLARDAVTSPAAVATLPLVTVMPPDATVSPVKLPSVPVIVLLPVIAAPPLATVSPVRLPRVPVIVLLPVIATPPDDTVNAPP